MKTKKIVKPIGYQAYLSQKHGSKIFGKECTIETLLIDDELDETAPPYAVFYGNISDDKIQRIAAILNEN